MCEAFDWKADDNEKDKSKEHMAKVNEVNAKNTFNVTGLTL